ncbi:MAG: PRC-barrel domain-containing protein [Burkholderiaceae bacterium]
MKTNHSLLPWATLVLAGSLGGAVSASAQVAGGTTTVDARVTESTQIATGWSVKKTLMGKTIYNDAGQKVGNVADLIISPDRNVSYVIVGAGGFVGIGRHDVAIPVTQIKDQAGKLVMPGATKDLIKSLPEFTYATDTNQRDQFVAAAEKDIATGRMKVIDLEKKSAMATTDAKAKIDLQITALQVDVKSAESKLTAMKQAAAVRWKEFEVDVDAATARLRKAVDVATS